MSDFSLAIGSLLRGLRLFGSTNPRTPLRVLCISALDTVYVHRRGRPISTETRRNLARLLDFQALTNAAWDRKPFSDIEYATLRQQLDEAGLRSIAGEYLTRLHDLETHRPGIHGDERRFLETQTYREGVARVSLATDIAATFGRMPDLGGDFDVLFRIAMQCQIMDDVLDYRVDRAGGLPSFLTAIRPLPKSLDLTANAARAYGAGASPEAMRPLRLALTLITLLTRLFVRLAPWRYGREQRREFTALGNLEETCRSAGSRPGSR